MSGTYPIFIQSHYHCYFWIEKAQKGDAYIKRDMACHIDGLIATVAHTHVIQEGPVTRRKADVITATNNAAEVALRLMRPTKKPIHFYHCRYVVAVVDASSCCLLDQL